MTVRRSGSKCNIYTIFELYQHSTAFCVPKFSKLECSNTKEDFFSILTKSIATRKCDRNLQKCFHQKISDHSAAVLCLSARRCMGKRRMPRLREKTEEQCRLDVVNVIQTYTLKSRIRAVPVHSRTHPQQRVHTSEQRKTQRHQSPIHYLTHIPGPRQATSRKGIDTPTPLPS